MITRLRSIVPQLLTGVRLPMAICLAISIRHGIGVVFAWVVALAALDLFDGALARWLGTDTNSRRLLDIVVDRLVTHIALIAAVYVHREFLALYVPVLTKDLVATLGFTRAVVVRRQLISGDRWHRLTSLANACMGLSFVLGTPEPAVACAAIAWCVNAIFLADHTGTYLAHRGGARVGRELVRVQGRNLAGLRCLCALVALSVSTVGRHASRRTG